MKKDCFSIEEVLVIEDEELFLSLLKSKQKVNLDHKPDVSNAIQKNAENIAEDLSKKRSIIWMLYIIAGVVVTLGALHYAPGKPINVFYYFFFVIVIPLAGLVLSLFLRPILKLMGLSLGNAGKFFWTLKGPASKKGKHIAAHFLSLQFSVASFLFAFASVAVLVLSGLISDLYFSWSSTFNFSTPHLYDLIRMIEIPWKCLLGLEFINLEVLEATKFNSMKQVFSDSSLSPNSDIHSSWLKFLIATTAFYGIGLRVCVVAFGALRLRNGLQDFDVSVGLKNRYNFATNSFGNKKEQSNWPEIVVGGSSKFFLKSYSEAPDILDLGIVKEFLTSTREEAHFLLLVVDAFESPDKSFQRFFKGLEVREDEKVVLLAINTVESGFKKATSIQKSVWQSVAALDGKLYWGVLETEK